jgi:formamidopyrimidine-DNA glycosylase
VSSEELQDSQEGAALEKVERIGKELHFIFNNKHVLGLHLMLQEQLTLSKEEQPKSLITSLKFDDGIFLSLTDFQAAATPTSDPKENKTPDALEIDSKNLKEKLSKTSTSVKTALTDQKIVRGIGNAYADEILWDARLSPFSASNKILANKADALAKSIKEVLEHAEKQILKERPDIITGEYRDFMEVQKPAQEENFNRCGDTAKTDRLKKNVLYGGTRTFLLNWLKMPKCSRSKRKHPRTNTNAC